MLKYFFYFYHKRGTFFVPFCPSFPLNPISFILKLSPNYELLRTLFLSILCTIKFKPQRTLLSICFYQTDRPSFGIFTYVYICKRFHKFNCFYIIILTHTIISPFAFPSKIYCLVFLNASPHYFSFLFISSRCDDKTRDTEVYMETCAFYTEEDLEPYFI